MGTVVLGLQVLLFVVFATAGIAKLRDEFGSRQALYDFDVPPRFIPFGARALPIAELVVAVGLLFPPTARLAAIGALILLGAFIFGIARALARGKKPDCHCFGQLHSAPAGASTLVRNGVLAAIAAVIVVDGGGPSISEWVGDRSDSELLAVVFGIVTVLVGVIALGLWSNNRLLRERLQRMGEELAALPPGLPIGAPAPAFELKSLEGDAVSLDSLRERGNPVLLVFAGADCGACELLLPNVGRWQDALSEQLSIVVLANGDPEDNRPLAERHALNEMLLQERYEVMTSYRVHATPAAVLIGPDGRIADETAMGLAAVEPLVRRTLANDGKAELSVTAVSPEG